MCQLQGKNNEGFLKYEMRRRFLEQFRIPLDFLRSFENKKATQWRQLCQYILVVVYSLLSHSSTSSGAMIEDTKVYAPVLGDFTIFMALVNRLEEDCKVATVFFAMAYYFIRFFLKYDLKLLNFFVKGMTI